MNDKTITGLILPTKHNFKMHCNNGGKLEKETMRTGG